MVTHHTQLKQKKSLDILDRALDYLIEAECPLELNGKMYKKINMSYGQILDAMHHVATPEEESGELIWTNSSSLSQYSKDYIEQAKDKRNNRYLEKIGYKTDKKISSLDKDIAIENLLAANNNLKREIAKYESIQKQSGINFAIEQNTPVLNKINNDDFEVKNFKRVFCLLLKELKEDNKISLTTRDKGDDIAYHSRKNKNVITLCSKSELLKFLEIEDFEDL
ncbi:MULTISPECIES: hypothetical protein [Aliarcobacter]|uniref:hypothetical protein n=1 Tax=Aliarcobacter TaxID=2321111 RepID=UPI0012474296|nr:MULTISPECIES: hypothetical protein [Aliarcobacter]MCT7557179.1 hypothetical protein [Aliarcobacter butzleri]QEZ88708.1 hypothetical protein ACIB15232_0554 [Aliarcobacter cibarius]